MSLTTHQIAAMEEAVRANLRKLKSEVLVERNSTALLSLLDSALLATRSLHELWSEHRPRRLFTEESVNELGYRREDLAYHFSSRDEFPILHRWIGRADVQQEQMLRSLGHGPFKSKWKQETKMRCFMEQVIVPAIGELRHTKMEPRAAIEREIGLSEPLSYENRKVWADMIARWVCWRRRDLMRTRGSWLWKLAVPEAELRRERRKRTKRWDAWERERKLHGNGQLDCIDATKLQERRAKIDRMGVTDAHIMNGLKAQIVAFLEKNLQADKMPP